LISEYRYASRCDVDWWKLCTRHFFRVYNIGTDNKKQKRGKKKKGKGKNKGEKEKKEGESSATTPSNNKPAKMTSIFSFFPYRLKFLSIGIRLIHSSHQGRL
jgi:hypothetical protein